MTREEAIRILDPETRREALREIPVFDRISADQSACRLAVSALRAQQEPNDPLTLEELREMDGEPVYLDFGGCGEWTLVRVLQNLEDNILLVHKNGIYAPAKFVFECGGHIYRRKPEEGK